jgi:hypothetical protein
MSEQRHAALRKIQKTNELLSSADPGEKLFAECDEALDETTFRQAD